MLYCFIWLDFAKCELAAKIDLEEVQGKVNKLNASMVKIENELSDPTKHGEHFSNIMTKFLTTATKKVDGLQTTLATVLALQEKMIEMFVERPKTPLGDILRKLDSFRKELAKAKTIFVRRKVKMDKLEQVRRLDWKPK